MDKKSEGRSRESDKNGKERKVEGNGRKVKMKKGKKKTEEKWRKQTHIVLWVNEKANSWLNGDQVWLEWKEREVCVGGVTMNWNQSESEKLKRIKTQAERKRLQ